MPGDKPSWIDYTNLVLSLIVGIIGVGVAVLVSRSADRLSANGLMVATATFLLDDSEKRQRAGIEIYTNLKTDQLPLPAWSDTFISHFLAQASAAPQSDLAAAREPAKGALEPANREAANQLFTALAGATPRLFIEIADEQQRAAAETLRRAISQEQLAGQSVVAPGVEKIGHPSPRIELRVLKAADRGEADQLAASLARLLGTPVPVADLSPNFDSRADVKRRTYELWFPHGQEINVTLAKS